MENLESSGDKMNLHIHLSSIMFPLKFSQFLLLIHRWLIKILCTAWTNPPFSDWKWKFISSFTIVRIYSVFSLETDGREFYEIRLLRSTWLASALKNKTSPPPSTAQKKIMLKISAHDIHKQKYTEVYHEANKMRRSGGDEREDRGCSYLS